MERKTFQQLLTEAGEQPPRRRYAGDPPETGGTSQKFPVAPGITWLAGKGAFDGAKKIVDYGAGKYARNADWLREQGYQVYAFDPYNGTDASGWEGVSKKLPRGKFDVGFSCFVLNVVPEHVEKEIINDLARIAKTRYHIVRNGDVFAAAKKGLFKGAQPMTDWFLNEFAGEEEKQALLTGNLSDDIIMDFAQFGFITKTSSGTGFQRIPTSEDFGLKLIHGSAKSAFKIYQG